IDELVHVALHRLIAAGRVGAEPTARFDGEVGRFLHRLDGEIAGRVEDDRALAADPGDNRRPVFVIIGPARLAFLPATTRAASQRFHAPVWCLPLLARRVIELIRFNGPLQLAVHLIRERGIAQPPAPAVAGTDLDTHFPGNAPRRTGEA